MVLLLDLPAGMLIKIFSMGCLSQSDIARAALVCKTINTIIIPNLYQQIDFPPYMPYSVVNWPQEDEVAMTYSKINLAVKQLLHTLATNKRLASTVTGLQLEANAFSTYQRKVEFDRLLDAFAELTFGTNHLTASRVVQSLKGLKVLEINEFWSKVLLRNPVLLPELERAVVRRSSGHPDGIFNLMMQPKLKDIAIQDSRLYGSPQASENPTSNVSHITLVAPWGGIQELQTLVQMTKHLKSLKLMRTLTPCHHHVHGAGPDCPCGINLPGPLSNEISEVLSLVAHCLEVLLVTHSHAFSPHDLDPSRMTALLNFRHLRELKIGASMILGARMCPDLHPGDALTNNELHGHDFAGCMPKSLRKLHLEIAREQLDRDDKYCWNIVESFLKYKIQLPNMTSLAMTEVHPNYRPACRCLVQNSCYVAKDMVNSSSPVEGILEMQRHCFRSGIELSYLSQRGTSSQCVRTLFLCGQDPQVLNKGDYDNFFSGWEEIGLTL